MDQLTNIRELIYNRSESCEINIQIKCVIVKIYQIFTSILGLHTRQFNTFVYPSLFNLAEIPTDDIFTDSFLSNEPTVLS